MKGRGRERVAERRMKSVKCDKGADVRAAGSSVFTRTTKFLLFVAALLI